jgi:hypothetical protein
MEAFIRGKINQWIPEEDRAEFLNIMNEDIKLLNFPRVAGMGITAIDFNAWKQGE